jgi:carboxyl-terminal processing protease
VVGTPTFGKGSVQTLFSLTGGNVLKLTTARWYTPRGRSIERVGEAGDGNAEPRPLALTVEGEYLAVPDTAGRPSVTSYGGRELLGGGGIVPDLVVLPDTLGVEEQRAVRTLYRQAGIVNTAVFSFAVEYLQQNDTDPERFALDDADMARFHERLRDRGLEADAEVLRHADRYLRLALERQIAQQAGGERAQFLRAAPGDTALQRALELLRGAGDPVELFVRAGSPIPGAGAGAGANGGTR